jgi:RNA 2',3'-cyclic 3'-phosphodiesterase
MRLFVGLALPLDIRHRLQALCSGIAEARWVKPENMHITLRFVGDVNGEDVDDLNDALAKISCPSFNLSLGSVDCFGSSKGVRSVWAGVEKSQELEQLQARVESTISRLGYGPEERKFTPHITLARFKKTRADKIAPFFESNIGFVSGPFPIEKFTLFRSHLGHEGAHYETLGEYPLLDPEG